MSFGRIDEIVIQKITSLQRCVARARDSRKRAGDDFVTDFDLQDAAVLNVIRACETAIDLANNERLSGFPSSRVRSFSSSRKHRA